MIDRSVLTALELTLPELHKEIGWTATRSLAM